MSAHRKQGEVYLQHQKHGQKWKRYWLALHPASQQGVARLELSEAVQKQTTLTRRHPRRKIVRLSDCISVVKLPPHAEACPEENMGAFCVETDSMRLIFAAERQSCGEWVEVICNIAFHSNSSPQHVALMEDNQLYIPCEQISKFKVAVLRTEASDRCGLTGKYCLLAYEDMLVLQDPVTMTTMMEWPYKSLRRFGQNKMLFSIEAGRRCESGPGIFNFETRQSEEIYRLIESAIHQPSPPLSRSRSPRVLPKFPESTSPIARRKPVYPGSLSSLHGAYSVVSLIEPVYTDPVISIGKPESVDVQPKKDQSTLQSSPTPHHKDDPEPPYSDPTDVIRSCPKLNYCVPNYTDTCYCQVAKPTSNYGKRQEPEYSEVYGHISLSSSIKTHLMIEDYVYSVPEVVTHQSNSSQLNNIPDEIKAVYSTVRKPSKTSQHVQEKNPS